MKYFVNLLPLMMLGFLIGCAQPAEPEKSKGVLRIATVPLDIPILVNGLPKGNSPSEVGQLFSISLEEGEYKIEILKPVDDEKDLYGSKSVLIAGDTLQTITIEAKERLTEFGIQEKTRKDAEAEALAKEKAREAELQKQKTAQITAAKAKKENKFQNRMNLVNREYIEILNSTSIKPSIKNPWQRKIHRFKASGCNITAYEDDLGKEMGRDDNSYKVFVDARNLDLAKSMKKYSNKFEMIGTTRYQKGVIYFFYCKDKRECMVRTHNTNFKANVNYESFISTIESESGQIQPIIQAVGHIIKNCQS